MRTLLAAAACLLTAEVSSAPVTIRFEGEVTTVLGSVPNSLTSVIGLGSSVVGVWTFDDEPSDSSIRTFTFTDTETGNDPTVFPGSFPSDLSASFTEAYFNAGVIKTTIGETLDFEQPSFIAAIASLGSIRFIADGAGLYRVVPELEIRETLGIDPPARGVDSGQQEDGPWLRLSYANFAPERGAVDECSSNDECFLRYYDPTTQLGPVTGEIGFGNDFNVPTYRFQVTSLVVVPEPAAISLLACCILIGTQGRRRLPG